MLTIARTGAIFSVSEFSCAISDTRILKVVIIMKTGNLYWAWACARYYALPHLVLRNKNNQTICEVLPFSLLECKKK